MKKSCNVFLVICAVVVGFAMDYSFFAKFFRFSQYLSQYLTFLISTYFPISFKALPITNGIPSNSIEYSEFEHLDDYSLLRIFDLLDFDDLVNCALVGSRYNQLITDHYIVPKYQLKGANILITVSEIDCETYVSYVTTGVKFVIGREKMFSTLRAFCYLFDQLTISDGIASVYDRHDIIENIIYHLNIYCSNVSQRINLPIPPRINNVDSVLYNVTDIQLIAPINYSAATIDQMFPRLEKFRFHVETFQAPHYTLDYHFQHLISIDVWQIRFGEFHLRSFAAHNPQIRDVEMKFGWSLERLHKINEVFPNMESLIIILQYEFFHEDAEEVESGECVKHPTGLLTAIKSAIGSLFTGPKVKPTPKPMPLPQPVHFVRFRNLKSFTFDRDDYYGFSWIRERFAAIEFDQLESFKIVTGHSDSIEEEIDWIVKNKGLISVELAPAPLNEAQKRRLVESLPKLRHLTIKCRDPVIMLSTLNMAKNSSLESLTFIFDHERVRELIGDAFAAMQCESVLDGVWWLHSIRDDKELNGLVFKRTVAK